MPNSKSAEKFLPYFIGVYHTKISKSNAGTVNLPNDFSSKSATRLGTFLFLSDFLFDDVGIRMV